MQPPHILSRRLIRVAAGLIISLFGAATPQMGCAQQALQSPNASGSGQQQSTPVDTGASSGLPSTVMQQHSFPPFRFNTSLAPQLSPTTTSILDNCQLNLPPGYRFQTQAKNRPVSPPREIQSFIGQAGPDGYNSVLVLLTEPIAAGKYDLTSLLRGVVADQTRAVEQEWTNVSLSPLEFGTIDGILFARVYFKGVDMSDPDTPAKRGFVYVTFDVQHSTEMRLFATDTQANGDKSLPVLEAAVLTFAPR